MKKYIILILVVTIQTLTAQVGIGTTTPTEMLDVKGDVLLDSTIKTNTIPTVTSTEDGFHFLCRLSNSTPKGLIKVLKTDNLNITPIRYQRYKIVNIVDDNVDDVDLGFSNGDYIVAVSSFKWNGSGLLKDNTTNNKIIGPFNIDVYQDGTTKTWHLSIKNNELNNLSDSTKPITFDITLCIFQTAYFKNVGTAQPVDLKGKKNGKEPLASDNNPANGTPLFLQ